MNPKRDWRDEGLFGVINAIVSATDKLTPPAPTPRERWRDDTPSDEARIVWGLIKWGLAAAFVAAAVQNHWFCFFGH